jgi:hypothetical protein
MRLRTAAAIAAALSVLGLVPAAASAAPEPARGVDITPPAAGDCHALTFAEAQDKADPDAAVPCTDAHTSVTTKVITFDSAPDWSSNKVFHQVSLKCERSRVDYFSATKALELSTYFTYFFYPTKAQQDAGATWARCDAALYGKNNLKPLPTDGDPSLGSLPLADGVAKCRLGKAAKYAIVSCDHAHRYHATTAIKRPGSYPGLKKMTTWTVDHCRARLGRSFGYYAAPTRFSWNAGLRYSVCYKTTRS